LDGVPRAYVCRGTNYLAEQVGAQNIQKMAAILRALEAKEMVIELIRRDIDRKIKIYIGQETACNEFADCAVAVSPFQTRRGPSGRIAVVGPTRMDYQRVVSALEYVSGVLKEMM
jgi:heat-inducible transcriptional repressor